MLVAVTARLDLDTRRVQPVAARLAHLPRAGAERVGIVKFVVCAAVALGLTPLFLFLTIGLGVLFEKRGADPIYNFIEWVAGFWERHL